MFEKEAKERGENYFKERCYKRGKWTDAHDLEYMWQDGAEFGYNRANEWHYMPDGDLPKVDNRIVLCVCGDGYIDGKKHYILKLLARKEFPLFQPVYAWKEIILPELPEEIE